MTRFLAPACTLLGLLITSSASANDFLHIDQLALRLERQARQLARQTVHFRHTPQYPHLVRDAAELKRLAAHVHEVAHHHGSVQHLAHDVRQMYRHFHHLQQLFAAVERSAHFGIGHVHGGTLHVRALLRSMEINLHHLADDVNRLTHHPVITRPVVVGHPVGPYVVRSHRGFGHGPRALRRRGIRFRIGF